MNRKPFRSRYENKNPRPVWHNGLERLVNQEIQIPQRLRIGSEGRKPCRTIRIRPFVWRNEIYAQAALADITRCVPVTRRNAKTAKNPSK